MSKNSIDRINERILQSEIDRIDDDDELRTAYDQLTVMERVFVNAYLSSGDSRKAAAMIGARGDVSMRAQDMFKRPLVQAAIAHKARELSERYEISADRIAKELALIAYGSLDDFMEETSAGDPFVNLAKASSAQRRTLQEISVEDFTDGRGDDARDVKRVKIKAYSKLDALAQLSKLMGYNAPEQIQSQVLIHHANVTVDMTPQEAAELYARTLSDD